LGQGSNHIEPVDNFAINAGINVERLNSFILDKLREPI
jgi:hypothetical protein